MTTTFIRLWFRSSGRWFYETYSTTDTNWQESFQILKETGSPVRIEYLDHDREADLGLPQKVSLLS
jgi:hypothetical protein